MRAELTQEIERMAREAGADLVGFAEVEGLAELPRAVVVAMRHSPEVLADPEDMPNRRYAEEYRSLNERLTELAERIAARLEEAGYEARVNQATVDRVDPETLAAPFSHKLAATRAGLGWVGKSALLVTRELGPALRMASVLTEAPLVVGGPVSESECGECVVCVEACPAGAIQGASWRAGMARGELLDARRCYEFRPEAAERNEIQRPRCGVCLAVCPRRAG
ncbi:MAG TPA: 4Fe-4S double cluster binding domain-containing protein [Armatimonadota bacterium]|nr:4Fe-4S double cluster binding domain-containing protein [Armatimonadota bacterium]